MNILELSERIKEIAEQDERLNSVYIADPYTKWNEAEVPYGSFVFYPTGEAHYDDYTDVTFKFYVGELHNEAQDNTLELQTLALDILHNILHRVDATDDIDIVLPMNFSLFEQGFQDVLCGAYGDCTFRIAAEFLCD